MTSPASVDAAAATGSPDSRKRVLDEMAQKAAKAHTVLEEQRRDENESGRRKKLKFEKQVRATEAAVADCEDDPDMDDARPDYEQAAENARGRLQQAADERQRHADAQQRQLEVAGDWGAHLEAHREAHREAHSKGCCVIC